MWKDGTRRGIAYVEGRATAEEVMTVTGRRRIPVEPVKPRRRGEPPPPPPEEQALEGAMAVYSDRRGRPFAWQIPFDIRQWEQVTALVVGTVPVPVPEPVSAAKR